jgi:hypothetical protein
MTVTFDLQNENSEFVYKVDDEIYLKIIRTSGSSAFLHFINESNTKILIPLGIKVYVKNYDHETGELNYLKQIHFPSFEGHALCFLNEYIVEFNDKQILYLAAQRSWNIHR